MVAPHHIRVNTTTSVKYRRDTSSMQILLATSGFAAPGGSETYLLTVAEQLQRLQHEVVICAEQLGAMAEFAMERGISVTDGLSELDGRCNVALVQDAGVSYRLAERFPELPQLFRAASDIYDFWLPPALSGLIGGVVVLSDRVGDRIASLSTGHEIHRLRQPIDTDRFVVTRRPATKPRRAVLLGNYLDGARLDAIVDALTRIGVECEIVGRHGRVTCEPERDIWEADIVVAKGRAALDGMACGKPVLVYDNFGGDGWVTPDRYPAMEADNFAGLSGPPIDVDAELSQYDPDMGRINRELVTAYHGARAHTHELCALLERTPAPTGIVDAPLAELSRLVRVQWRTEMRTVTLEWTARRAAEEADRERTRSAELADRVMQLESETTNLARDNAVLAGELDRFRALERTRRVRAAVALGRVADRGRSALHRNGS